MQLEQSFTLPVPPAQAAPAFRQIELLIDCLPGAALTGPAVDGEWPLRLDVKLGPIAVGFVGTGRVSFDEAAHSGGFEGSAVDRRTKSRVKGHAAFSIASEDTGSRVQVTVDYSLTGTLAQFSRGGIVRELASALTAQFAANLSARLKATAVTAAVEGALAEAAVAPAPLDGLALLWQMVRARWVRLLNRLLRRAPA